MPHGSRLGMLSAPQPGAAHRPGESRSHRRFSAHHSIPLGISPSPSHTGLAFPGSPVLLRSPNLSQACPLALSGRASLPFHHPHPARRTMHRPSPAGLTSAGAPRCGQPCKGKGKRKGKGKGLPAEPSPAPAPPLPPLPRASTRGCPGPGSAGQGSA